jgi:hypothetical protein
MTNTYTNSTLNELDAAIAEGDITAEDVVAICEERLARQKPGSYKARRYAIVLTHLHETGRIDVKASFESAKADPKPKASKAKAPKAPKRKAAPKAAETGPLHTALAAYAKNPTPANLAKVAAFVKA